MKVDLKELQSKIDSLDKIINEYETNILNLYNQLLSASIYWKDEDSLKFNERISFEKKQASIKFLELKSVKETFKYLISKYENIGQKIVFDLKSKEKINKFLDDYISQLEKISNHYNQINLSNYKSIDNGLSIKLTNQKLVVKKLKNNMKTIKDNINENFNKLEEIEIQIAERLNKLKIVYIKEINSI